MLDSERATLQRKGSHRQRDIDSTDVLADGGPDDDRDEPAWVPRTGDECPQCGAEITSITATGPARFHLTPCGHVVGGVTR